MVGYSYEFGPYRLDPLEHLLTKGGTSVPLSPKAFEVLLFFVRNNGKALSKDELMKAGWGDTFVEEANLTQTISVLRKALGEGPDERVYIETIPKHGYRFRPPVESKPVAIPVAPDDRRMDSRKRLLGLIGAAALLVALCVLLLARRLMTEPSALSVPPRFVPLVTDPGVRLYPSWAPDSKKIAFVGEVNGHLQVFTKTLGSPMSTQVTNQSDDCIHPFWSPDGTHIYFGAAANLWRVGANGGDPTLVMPRVFQASLARDSSALAFIGARAGTGLGDLFISKPAGAPPKRYSEKPFADRQYLGPATVRFSPDGKKLAVSILLRETRPEFWLLPFPSGRPVELLSTLHPSSFISGQVQFSWMPDSRHIVFAQSSLFVSSPHLWMLDTADGSIHALSSGTGTEMTPSVSPDGKRIAFASIRGSYDLVEVPVDGSPLRDFLATSRNEVTPAWSPLGTHVAYATDRGGPREIWLRDVREGWERPIVTQRDFGDDLTFQFWDICFSPDGQRITYRRIGQSGEAIWISTLAGDPPERLINDPEKGYQRGPAWSPDGNWLAYYATSIKTSIMKVRLGGNGVPVIIRSDVGIYPRWSPNGKWLLSGGPGLFLSTPDGSSSLKVSDRSYLVHGWSKDGSLAYGIRNTGRRLVLDSIDPWTKQEKLVADFGPTPGSWLFGALDANILFRGFSINPDGKSFLTSMFRATSDLWLLENYE